MGTFSGGFMVDPATGRPVAGATVRVTEYGTDAPVTPTTGPVATGVHGGYQSFHVEGVDAVTLRAGDVEQVLVSIEKQLAPATGGGGGSGSVVDNGDGSVTVTGSALTDNGDGSVTVAA